jgi:hypothetical protein
LDRKHEHLIEALARVEDFLGTNQAVMANVITSKAHQNFSSSRERLVEYMKTQAEHTRGMRSAVAVKRRLAARLVRNHFRRIGIVARKHLRAAEEFSALTPPRGRPRHVALVAAGHGMARAARVHEAALLEAGLPADFLEQLVAATDALEAGITARGRAESLRVEATAGLDNEARVARFALRLLDSLVRSAVAEDDALIDRWGKVSRIAAAAISTQTPSDGDGGPGGPSGGGDAPAGPPPTTPPAREVQPAA